MDALRLARIQFAVGVATGIVVEFRFGTNWAEYSMYVGKVLGGVPFDAPGDSTGTFVGLLNPYALLVGVQALAMFTARSSLSPGSSAPASWNRPSRSPHPHRRTP